MIAASRGSCKTVLAIVSSCEVDVNAKNNVSHDDIFGKVQRFGRDGV